MVASRSQQEWPGNPDARLYQNAASDAQCCRCDGPITAGEPAVTFQGLDSPGQAHLRCAPDTNTGLADP